MQGSSSTAMTILYESELIGSGQQSKHLINTQKIVKGHKLTMKDYLKTMLMKTKHISPNQYEVPFQSIFPIESNQSFYSQENTFINKLHAYDTIEDQKQLVKFIQKERIKNSRETKKRIKLFSMKTKQTITEQNRYNSNISKQLSNKQTQGKRTSNLQVRKKRSNKTEDIELRSLTIENVRNATAEPTARIKNKIQFYSSNLGGKLNSYLNFIISKKSSDSNFQYQDFVKESQKISIPKPNNHHTDSEKIHQQPEKKKVNNFYRKMKLSRKNKINSDQFCSEKYQSIQLTKSMLKSTARKQKTNKDDFQRQKFYTVMLRKNENTSEHSNKCSKINSFANTLTMDFQKIEKYEKSSLGEKMQSQRSRN